MLCPKVLNHRRNDEKILDESRDFGSKFESYGPDIYQIIYGRIAQLVRVLPSHGRGRRFSRIFWIYCGMRDPASKIKNKKRRGSPNIWKLGHLAQLVRASPSHGEGRRFDPPSVHILVAEQKHKSTIKKADHE